MILLVKPDELHVEGFSSTLLSKGTFPTNIGVCPVCWFYVPKHFVPEEMYCATFNPVESNES